MSETPVKPETEEIDLLELAKKIWAKRRFIIKYALIGAVAGLVIGFSLPKRIHFIGENGHPKRENPIRPAIWPSLPHWPDSTSVVREE